MRSPQISQTKDGALRYKVRFRLNGMQSSQTFDAEDSAMEFCHLIEDLGGADAALRYLDKRDDIQKGQALTLTKWFTQYKAMITGVEERTLVEYQRTFDRHIKPALGGYPLDLIDRPAVAGFINKLAKGDLSAKTIANIHGILSACLNGAVSQRKIDTNPCHGMRLPRSKEVESEDARFLTHAEYNALEAAMPLRWQPLLLTLVGTGMRWSEATAMRVGEVNLTGTPTMRIIRSTKWVPGVGHKDGVPKTKKSRRTVILPRQVVEVVTPLVQGRHRDELLFTAVRGGRVRHSGFHRLVWKRACAKAGLDPAPRIHDLRHSFASWMIEAGIGLEAIQDQLGHESILTTRKVYGHLQPAMREALAVAASQALAIGRTQIER